VIFVSTDIVVVGGGPTGSFSALQAAKLGAQVTICEEHNKVGVPSHCTGHISLAGIRRFPVNLPKKIFENEIKSAIFYSPSGYRFSVRFSSPITCVVNRKLFDQYLSNIASKVGVKIFSDTHVGSLLFERGFVRGVVVRRKKKAEKLLSKIVIDAEGVSSNILKRANLPSLDRCMVVNGVQAEVDKIILETASIISAVVVQLHIKGLNEATLQVSFTIPFHWVGLFQRRFMMGCL